MVHGELHLRANVGGGHPASDADVQSAREEAARGGRRRALHDAQATANYTTILYKNQGAGLAQCSLIQVGTSRANQGQDPHV